MYDQTLNKETGYACVLFGFLHILLFQYGINVKNNGKDVRVQYAWILKFVGWLRYAGVLLTWGAVTSTLYNTCVNRIRSKLGLNFRIISESITRAELQDGKYYGIGIKNLSTYYRELAKDGRITREEIDKINLRKGSGHHLVFKMGENIAYDSYGAFTYHLPFENLQYWVKTGFAYDTARTLEVGDEFTSKTLDFLERIKNKDSFTLKDFSGEERRALLLAGKLFRRDFSDLGS